MINFPTLESGYHYAAVIFQSGRKGEGRPWGISQGGPRCLLYRLIALSIACFLLLALLIATYYFVVL